MAHSWLTVRLKVWCSSKKRSVQLASALGRSFMTWHALDELDFGSCTGLTVSWCYPRAPPCSCCVAGGCNRKQTRGRLDHSPSNGAMNGCSALLAENYLCLQDPLHWRFPRGESVVDVIHRLEPIFVECERQKQPVIIVSHVVPLQVWLCSLLAH